MGPTRLIPATAWDRSDPSESKGCDRRRVRRETIQAKEMALNGGEKNARAGQIQDPPSRFASADRTLQPHATFHMVS